MKKLPFAIAAAATLAALSAVPSSAKSISTEQQQPLDSFLIGQTTIAPKTQARPATFTNGPPKPNRYENAKKLPFKNRPPRGG